MRKFLCTYSGCNATVTKSDGDKSQTRCAKHQQVFTPKKVYKDHHFHKQQYFYHTQEWRNLRDWYYKQHPLCENCQRLGMVTAATEIDHIKEISDGGDKLNAKNLQSLCTPCHRKKTGEMVRKRRQRKHLNGFHSIDDL